MIVDTSALVAVLLDEDGGAVLLETLTTTSGAIPAPVCVEFLQVAGGQRFGLRAQALSLLEKLDRLGHVVVAFTARHVAIATAAEPIYGAENGSGGPLNLLDLMVYAIAKERGEPLLCTGKDFAATDLKLHVASRPY